MLRNYLKIAIRNLRKQKLYSLINISGLAMGLACCILIYLFVRHEYSYDAFHANGDRIFRIEDVTYDSVTAAETRSSFFDTRAPEGVRKSAHLPLPLGPTLKARYPEIARFVRYDYGGNAVLRVGDKIFEETITYVEPNFFEVFSFPLLQGTPGTALADKNSLVLTPEMSRKYFGDVNPVGETVQVKIRNDEQAFVVTGVAEAPPSNSSLRFDVVLPIQQKPFYERHRDYWRSFNTSLFLELTPGTVPSQFKSKLDAFVQERFADYIEELRVRQKMPEDAIVMEFGMTPLTGIHLDAAVGWEDVSNPLYSYILSAIAILILLIACINYVTLAMMRSASRAREVGIRKVAGAHRRQIAWQFWGETQVMTLFAMALAVGLAELFLPVFNALSGKTLTLSYAGNIGFLSLLLGIGLVTGLLAGSYPALFLARFDPTDVLKGLRTSRFRPRLTRVLLVLQYSLSIFLIIGSLIMYRQLDYVTQKDLGYQKDQVVVIPTHTGWTEAGTQIMRRFREEVSDNPNIVSVSGMTPAFTNGWNIYGFGVGDEQKEAFIYAVDEQFIETLDIPLLAGRNFGPGETDAVLVNEALVASMGWEEAIGQQLPWRGEDNPSTVIGVVQDFHFQSLEAPIKPMLLHMDPEQGGISSVLVKIRPTDMATTLSELKEAWDTVAEFTPFDYWFLDDAVAQQYASYLRWMQIMGYATAFAILIACLGLFGLAGLNAVNKTKEIGIRKVLGAGVDSIIVLLNKDIVMLIVTSLVLAAPVSWYVMESWLSGFAYRVDIGASVFLISGVLALTIALLTVSFHAVRAALANPVESLRYE